MSEPVQELEVEMVRMIRTIAEGFGHRLMLQRPDVAPDVEKAVQLLCAAVEAKMEEKRALLDACTVAERQGAALFLHQFTDGFLEGLNANHYLC